MVDFLKGRSTKLELAELRKITNHYHWLHTFCFVSIPLSSPGDRISYGKNSVRPSVAAMASRAEAFAQDDPAGTLPASAGHQAGMAERPREHKIQP